MNLDDDAFKEATAELEEISVDFCENYKLAVDEFNGMMLAQIVRFYIDNDEFDEIKRILSDVLTSINEIESGKRVSFLDQFNDEDEQ